MTTYRVSANIRVSATIYGCSDTESALEAFYDLCKVDPQDLEYIGPVGDGSLEIRNATAQEAKL
jgi:hypothetical protein